MKRISVLILLTVMVFVARAQKFSGKIANHNNNNVEVNLKYDIRLKKGLNLLEYQIQSVFKTNPDVRAAFPDKVKITNSAENPPIMWMASYFW